MPQIEVAFDIDANGIVHVHAKDLATGKEQSMTVTGGSALGKDDIDRMVQEAEAHAEEDRKRREAVEMRNEADNLVFRTEKLISENADKITDDVKTPVEEAIAEVKTALEGTDDDAVKAAVEKLNTTSAALGQAMYAAAQARSRRRPRLVSPATPHQRRDGSSGSTETTWWTPRSWTRTRPPARRISDRGLPDQEGTGQDDGEHRGPTVRDRRRIDPETDQVREPQETAAPGLDRGRDGR